MKFFISCRKCNDTQNWLKLGWYVRPKPNGQKIENHKAKFLTIRLNRKGESPEYSVKNRAY